MFDRLTLSEDLRDCRGEVIGSRGLVVSPEAIDEAARHAPSLPRVVLEDTPLGDDVAVPLDDPAYGHLFSTDEVRDTVLRTLRTVRLPAILFEELLLSRRTSPLHRHALATAAVGVRMLLAAVGKARGNADVAAAGLLHDIGMRHLPPLHLGQRERLAREDADRIAAHPLLGAYHLATVLGPHAAVSAALCHHLRCGQGYPTLSVSPSRSSQVVAVASAFAALTAPRPFRSAAYDARGAADVLIHEAKLGHADGTTVKLLVHALRGGRGDPRDVHFAAGREGHGPDVNRHEPVSAPARSPL